MISVATITLRALDTARVARFWRDMLDYTVAPNESHSVLLVGDGPSLLVQPATQTAPTSSIHLDLRPQDHDHAVAHALRLGARHADIGQQGDEGWTVLADPEDNLFCILESTATHQARLHDNPGSLTPIDSPPPHPGAA